MMLGFHKSTNSTLGKVQLPDHPLMRDVKKITFGAYCFIGLGAVHPNATVVAEYNHGAPLVLTQKDKNVICLNLYPPSIGFRVE